ncbi:MAG TPA: phosphatase PAP2 family protein [Cytophagales bacterium]|nr:phosphatase PAP2 family protein [Cytophagales bacterium]
MYIFASIISSLGHPLLTSAIFILFITFYLYDLQKALLLSMLIIGGLIVPVTGWNYLKTIRGDYTNFDVSERKNRNSMYLLISGLMIILIVVLFVTKQSDSLMTGMFFALGLILISFIANLFIKVSLHTSLSFFLSFATLTISVGSGIAMIIITMIIAASRLILKRHTLSEVVTGGIIGIATGGGLWYYFEEIN